MGRLPLSHKKKNLIATIYGAFTLYCQTVCTLQILSNSLQYGHFYPHFIVKRAEFHGDKAICLRSYSFGAINPALPESKVSYLLSHATVSFNENHQFSPLTCVKTATRTLLMMEQTHTWRTKT